MTLKLLILFPTSFYKTCWHILGNKVILEVQNCSLTLKRDWNHIFITLISKTNNPTSHNEYCPINLCNMVYKIISRILVKRAETYM